jgi:hypothetical protein
MALARLFYRPHYASEATQLIARLHSDHPELQEAQRQGRARLWDHDLNRDLLDEFSAARIAQRPYVYMTGDTDHDD